MKIEFIGFAGVDNVKFRGQVVPVAGEVPPTLESGAGLPADLLPQELAVTQTQRLLVDRK